MCLSFQEKKFKIDFQDANCGGHLVFPIGMILTILTIFEVQATSMFLTKFQVNRPFSACDGDLGIPIGTVLAVFHLLVSPMLPTKFRVNWPFGSGEETK